MRTTKMCFIKCRHYSCTLTAATLIVANKNNIVLCIAIPIQNFVYSFTLVCHMPPCFFMNNTLQITTVTVSMVDDWVFGYGFFLNHASDKNSELVCCNFLSYTHDAMHTHTWIVTVTFIKQAQPNRTCLMIHTINVQSNWQVATLLHKPKYKLDK